jgi:hypothetical protein
VVVLVGRMVALARSVVRVVKFNCQLKQPHITYDVTRDAFIPPTPYPSWVLDEATCLWVAPIPMPTDGADYVWDEQAGDWIVAEA